MDARDTASGNASRTWIIGMRRTTNHEESTPFEWAARGAAHTGQANAARARCEVVGGERGGLPVDAIGSRWQDCR